MTMSRNASRHIESLGSIYLALAELFSCVQHLGLCIRITGMSVLHNFAQIRNLSAALPLLGHICTYDAFSLGFVLTVHVLTTS